MGALDRLRRPPKPVVLSRFGAFGPGTGLVVALHELAFAAPRDRWRLFGRLWLDAGDPECDELAGAIDELEHEVSGNTIAGMWLYHAGNWSLEVAKTAMSRLPDQWFDGHEKGGRKAIASGMKGICADRLASAAIGLAGMSTGPIEAAGVAYGIASILVPTPALFERARRLDHPQLIAPYRKYDADLRVLPDAWTGIPTPSSIVSE